jgi:acetoin:2,6-dichlorophenolindophenol oxidoreductase subunit beta
VPLDMALIESSVAKTGRLVVAEPGNFSCGAGAEISARVVERCWDHLHGPVLRVATPDVHVPFSPALEDTLYPGADDIAAKVRQLVDAG